MIISLAGRRIDAPNADVKRFPLENVEKVKGELNAFFQSYQPEVLICSGACGADLLSLEVAGKKGIQRIMILPFMPEQFKEQSVIDRPGKWGEMFDRINNELEEKKGLIVLNYSVDDPAAYEKTNLEILKLAEYLSQPAINPPENPKQVWALALWEGKSRGESDTTAHFIQEAHKRNMIVKEIITYP